MIFLIMTSNSKGAKISRVDAEAVLKAQHDVPSDAFFIHPLYPVVERHGRILFATDTPSAPTYANPPGVDGWLEMHRLIEAGETPAQIFKSATLTNARALNLDRDIGTVQVGKRASLLLLPKDPTQTIDA
jgi:imidazolonepropionase-like amidohydrolase